MGQVAAPQTNAQRLRNGAERERWQTSGRRLPGASSAALRHGALQQKLAMRHSRALAAPTAGISGAWISLGPLPLPSDASGVGLQDYNWVSGRATTVAIDPNDPSGNTVYAGGAYGGVWKSINAGNLSPSPVSVNWTPLTDDQATLAIGAIAVQPQLGIPNPANSVVLAGTGETNSSGDSYYGLGILRSADAGQTWTLIPQDANGTHSFAGLGFSQIAFSTANPNVVVAAAGSATEGIVEGLENPITTNRGLYYSTDAGVTWRNYGTKLYDPFLSIDRYATDTEHNADELRFFDDVSAGMLPSVVWVRPSAPESEHPGYDISQGEQWTVGVVNAIMRSSYWSSTAILLTWDDAGDVVDHVPPPVVEREGSGVPIRYGHRVALIVISPYTPAGTVSQVLLSRPS